MVNKSVAVKTAEKAVLEFSKTSFDLVVTDFQMPGMDGLALSRHIKSAAPDMPILLITGLRGDDIAEGLRRGWVDPILHKPFNFSVFIETIPTLLQTQSRTGHR